MEHASAFLEPYECASASADSPNHSTMYCMSLQTAGSLSVHSYRWIQTDQLEHSSDSGELWHLLFQVLDTTESLLKDRSKAHLTDLFGGYGVIVQ